MVEKPQGGRTRAKQEDGKGGGEPILRDCQQDDASSGRKVRKSGGNDKQEGDCIVFHGGVIFYFLEVSVKVFSIHHVRRKSREVIRHGGNACGTSGGGSFGRDDFDQVKIGEFRNASGGVLELVDKAGAVARLFKANVNALVRGGSDGELCFHSVVRFSLWGKSKRKTGFAQELST